MDWGKIILNIILVAIASASIANSAIAMECYNDALKKEKPNNYYFLIINMVLNLLLIIWVVYNQFFSGSLGASNPAKILRY
jgi:hypothetical protein